MDLAALQPAYYSDELIIPQVERVRHRIASTFGANPEEIAIVRNATEALQTVLGDHHDAVAAEEWLRLAAVGGNGMAGFAAGLRAAHERRLQRKLGHEWREVWAELSSKKVTRWLRTA